jgi:hypothetical protein
MFFNYLEHSLSNDSNFIIIFIVNLVYYTKKYEIKKLIEIKLKKSILWKHN